MHDRLFDVRHLQIESGSSPFPFGSRRQFQTDSRPVTAAAWMRIFVVQLLTGALSKTDRICSSLTRIR